MMSPSHAISRGRRYFYYVCGTVNHGFASDCKIRRVGAESLEEIVVEKILEMADNEKLLGGLVEEANKEYHLSLEPLNRQKKSLEIELTRIKKNERGLIDQVLEDNSIGGLKAVKGRLIEFSERRDAIEKEIILLEEQIREHTNRVINTEVMQDSFVRIRALWEELTSREKKELFHLMINKIIYTPEQIELEIFELPEIGIIPEDRESLVQCPVWLLGRDSNSQPCG